MTGEQLATLLEKDRHYLRNKHLTPMVRDGRLKFRYPESAKHPNQAIFPEREISSQFTRKPYEIPDREILLASHPVVADNFPNGKRSKL